MTKNPNNGANSKPSNIRECTNAFKTARMDERAYFVKVEKDGEINKRKRKDARKTAAALELGARSLQQRQHWLWTGWWCEVSFWQRRHEHQQTRIE